MECMDKIIENYQCYPYFGWDFWLVKNSSVSMHRLSCGILILTLHGARERVFRLQRDFTNRAERE